MKKLFVGSLPPNTTEESLTAMFSPYGPVRSLKLVTDVFTGQCKGFAFLQMEGHNARAAIAALDGNMHEGKPLKIRFEDESAKGRKGRRR